MQVRIISVQRHPQKEVQKLEEEYLKRLAGCVNVQVVNLRPKTDAQDKEKTLREEEKLIQKELRDDEKMVVLDPRGREYATSELARFLAREMGMGTKNLVFLIGGPQGISSKILERAREKWSLSRLTFPHRLVRLLVLEALYRAFDLVRGGPYHKE